MRTIVITLLAFTLMAVSGCQITGNVSISNSVNVNLYSLNRPT